MATQHHIKTVYTAVCLSFSQYGKREHKITKEHSKSQVEKILTITITKNEKHKSQTAVYKTRNRKPEYKKNEPYQN